jgi:hypothetical protein
MNPRTRRMALYAIGTIAILASLDALVHSYTGLYGWAVHHRLYGWQALSWPAEIDVFLLVGELALYVAYLDAWPGRQRVWPWVTAVTGLFVSVAGNVGHIQAMPGVPVTLADRLTAATSPVAAFAGLMIGLLVLKMNWQHERVRDGEAESVRLSLLSRRPSRNGALRLAEHDTSGEIEPAVQPSEESQLFTDAAQIVTAAHVNGEKLSRRALAAQLRARGHRFSNAQLQGLACSVSQASDRRAA